MHIPKTSGGDKVQASKTEGLEAESVLIRDVFGSIDGSFQKIKDVKDSLRGCRAFGWRSGTKHDRAWR